MATKADTFKEAQKAGLVSADASADDYTIEALEQLLGRAPVSGTEMTKKAVTEPDGHQVVTQEDIDARA